MDGILKCCLCLNSFKNNIFEAKKEVYQLVFSCIKEHFNEEMEESSRNWVYSDDYPAPFCSACFQSSEEIHNVQKQVLELQEMLDTFIAKLRIEVKERNSCGNEELSSVEIKSEYDYEIKEEIHSVEDCDSNISFPNSEEQSEICSTFSLEHDYFYPKNKSIDSQVNSSVSQRTRSRKADLKKTKLINIGEITYPDENKNANTNKNHRVATTTTVEANSINQIPTPVTLNSTFSTTSFIHMKERSDFPLRWPGLPVMNPAPPVCLPGVLYKVNIVCDICQSNFSNLQDMMTHRKSHTADTPATDFSCCICSKAFVDRYSLNKHIMSHRTYKTIAQRKTCTIYCDICGKPTIGIYEYRQHRLSHNGPDERPYKCQICSASFNYKRSERRHRDVHLTEKSHKCTTCGKTFKTKVNLKNHMETHRNDLPHACMICKKQFKYRCSLKSHRIQHEEKKMTYSCNLCSKTFSSISLRRNHQRVYHREGGRKEYPCTTCGKVYITSGGLLDHTATHKSNFYECSVCKKKFKTPLNFKTHMKTHEDRKFKCTKCDKQFSKAAFLKVHNSVVHSREDVACSICGKKFLNQSKVKNHIMNVHELERKCVCPICGSKFKFKTQLNAHIEVLHNKVLKFECSTCGKRFGQKVNLNKHEEVHKEDDRKRFKCEICGDKYYTQSTGLRIHQNQFHTAYIGIHPTCGQCQHKFANGSEMAKHCRKVGTKNRHKCTFCKELYYSNCDLFVHYSEDHHAENNPLQCQKCQIVFNGPLTLKDHIQANCIETESGVVLLKCSICGEDFDSRQKLIKHRSDRHEKKRNYSCPVCRETFDNRMKLAEHKRERKHNMRNHEKYFCEVCGKAVTSKYTLKCHELRHRGENAFVCYLCGKGFITGLSLKNHELMHANSRTHTCEICGKGFALLQYLKLHKNVHTEEKKFSCTICGKEFLQNGNLKRHLKTHTGVKPYECHICNKAFIQKLGLQTHIRTHTGERPFSCEKCEKTFSDLSTFYKHRKLHKQ